MRFDYPEEEIAACSKEEALEACRDLAEALGYREDNSEVEVYALTADALNRNYEQLFHKSGGGRPSKHYFKMDPELGVQLPDMENQKEWTEEYEAMYLAYRPVIKDRAVACDQELYVIYAPKYGRIVYASWSLPYLGGETVEQEPAISEEVAVKTAGMEYGVKSEDEMVLDGTRLILVQTYRDTMKPGSDGVLIPAWQVDLHLLNSVEYSGSNAYRTALVDARTGKICQVTGE